MDLSRQYCVTLQQLRSWDKISAAINVLLHTPTCLTCKRSSEWWKCPSTVLVFPNIETSHMRMILMNYIGPMSTDM